jgi:hypothetical protein
MPRRTATRTQNRTKAINNERHHNEQALQADAEERARQQREDPGNTRGGAYFGSKQGWVGDRDPPPF